jgi:hypothetical protein
MVFKGIFITVFSYTACVIITASVIPAEAGIRNQSRSRLNVGMMARTRLMSSCIPGRIVLPGAKDETPAPTLPAKRGIPKITFKNLSPPYEDYPYFQHHEHFPFEFGTSSFSVTNAWWLAEASTLVYADEGFVRSQFSRAGLSQVKFFDKQSTQCYVANNDQFAIVAFRGSEFWKKEKERDLNEVFADVKTNADIRLTDWPLGGKVHRGFERALAEVWFDLLPHVTQLDSQGCKIWMTGHSLGAALATLAAGRYGNVQGLYTLGSPRVGNDEFKENWDVKTYRIVNNDDIVARLPPPGIYVHIGELKFIDRKGKLRDHRTETEPSLDPSRDGPYGQENANQENESSFGSFVPSGIRDHVPLLYAIHLWNGVVENQKGDDS